MDAISIELAADEDAAGLRRAAVSAFAVEGRFKPAAAKGVGPPGHGSLKRHRAWIRDADYYKCTVDGEIVGGCIVMARATLLVLSGLFIERARMGRGLGSRLLRAVMARYPAESTWHLETPDFEVRNHRFYERHGFHMIGKTPPDPDLGYGFRRYERTGERGAAADGAE